MRVEQHYDKFWGASEGNAYPIDYNVLVFGRDWPNITNDADYEWDDFGFPHLKASAPSDESFTSSHDDTDGSGGMDSEQAENDDKYDDASLGDRRSEGKESAATSTENISTGSSCRRSSGDDAVSKNHKGCCHIS